MDRINAIASKAAILDPLVRLHLLGVDAMFRLSSGPDWKDSTHVIGEVDQGGLGLPDRDYYLKDDPKSVELRKQYLAHVQKMLELAGEPAAKAASDAQAVMRFETDLAKGSLDRVTRRDVSQADGASTLFVGSGDRLAEIFRGHGRAAFGRPERIGPEFLPRSRVGDRADESG
jgi:endothelin-converting enzyme/putative endopeptidase